MARRKAPAVGAGVPGDIEDPPDKPIDQPERGPGIPTAAVPARASVDVDTLVQRPDLGPGRVTFVAAGQQIPAGLENYPRGPA